MHHIKESDTVFYFPTVLKIFTFIQYPKTFIVILLYGIYLKELTRYQGDICTPMFILTFFTIAKRQKQLKAY